VGVGGSDRFLAADRGAVERTARDLVLGVLEQRAPAGVSVVVEGAPGIGKTFLAREILAAIEPGAAKVLQVAGKQGRRNDPFTVAHQLLGDLTPDDDPAEVAFDLVDQLCADGPVMLLADDTHHLDAASLTLLRRLVWASGSLPLAILVMTRPSPSREPLAMLIRQARAWLRLPPMGRMMVDRLVFDQTGRWPGPSLGRILELAAGNPLFVRELLRGYAEAGALADAGPDLIEARFELDLQAVGLSQVIQRHLRQLDEPIREVLAAMAVWGTDIGVDDLASMLFSSAAALDPIVQGAVSSGLIGRDRAGTISFSHDLFREVAYQELTEPRRRAGHRRAAEVLTAIGYRPSLVADHLLQAARTEADPALLAALLEAVAATSQYAPEVTSDLLDDVAAVGADVPEGLLADHAEALFRRGRGESAETLIRGRIATITEPGIAARLQAILIRSLMNRAEVTAALAVIEQTIVIPSMPAAAVRQLEGTRVWLLVLAGRGPPAAELDALMARFTAAGDSDAQASVLSSAACTAFLAGRAETALDYLRAREALPPSADGFRSRNSSLSLPAMFELAASGPAAARAQVDRSRKLAAEQDAAWVDPFLGTAAGGIAFAAGDWDDAVAELDAALELAEETGTGWISLAVGFRAYIDAHRGSIGPAQARLGSFRHRGLPLVFGQDRPGWAELAVLEAEGRIREAGMLARTVWSAARDRPDPCTADLALDTTRVALTGMDRRLAGQIYQDVPAVCPPAVSLLVRGMIDADPGAIGEAADQLGNAGRLTAEAFAREELACAVAAAGDQDRASAVLDLALTAYQRLGAVPDQDRALARARVLGVRRSSRKPHRDAVHGWAALTVAEVRIAALVREGLTNREIGSRLFVSPRTVQTHVSHILQKTGLRSRVEIARFAET
jgi:DNA-binding CsgD family transcriptional regulator